MGAETVFGDGLFVFTDPSDPAVLGAQADVDEQIPAITSHEGKLEVQESSTRVVIVTRRAVDPPRLAARTRHQHGPVLTRHRENAESRR